MELVSSVPLLGEDQEPVRQDWGGGGCVQYLRDVDAGPSRWRHPGLVGRHSEEGQTHPPPEVCASDGRQKVTCVDTVLACILFGKGHVPIV